MAIPLFLQLVNDVAEAEPIDWSKYNDSVLIRIERPKGHKIGSSVCTGVIFHPKVILTNAHCAADATAMNVVFDVEKGPNAQKMERVLSSQMVIHPGYRPKESLYENDLALVFLEKPAPISKDQIRAIPWRNTLKKGDRLTRLGVGLRDGKNLRNLTNPIYLGSPKKGVIETADEFPYFGDSGGPLYNSKHELVAIHSTMEDFEGKKTPHTFAVYLAEHLAWIRETIKKRL